MSLCVSPMPEVAREWAETMEEGNPSDLYKYSKVHIFKCLNA